MTDLVYVKKDDAFTDSLVIAEATDNQHRSVVRIINKQRKRLEKFGPVKFRDLKSRNSKRGRPTKVYQLNEPQATLLITYLSNGDKVDDFKEELVRQFFQMRMLLAQRKTDDWVSSRKRGMLTRREETDTIKQLVEYAKAQGSTHSDKLYVVYSSLANKFAGVRGRDTATTDQLNDLRIYEKIALNMIQEGMAAGKHYKDIYQDTKARFTTVQQMAFLA